MESDKQVAAKIVDDWFQIGVQDYPNGDCDYYITSKRWEKRSEEAKELKNHIASAIANALQAARTPPHGHIIDDAGVVRKVMHVSKYPGVSFLTIHSEAAEAAKDGKATKATNDKCKVCRCHISGHHGPSVGCEGCGGSCPCMLTKQEVADQ